MSTTRLPSIILTLALQTNQAIIWISDTTQQLEMISKFKNLPMKMDIHQELFDEVTLASPNQHLSHSLR